MKTFPWNPCEASSFLAGGHDTAMLRNLQSFKKVSIFALASVEHDGVAQSISVLVEAGHRPEILHRWLLVIS